MILIDKATRRSDPSFRPRRITMMKRNTILVLTVLCAAAASWVRQSRAQSGLPEAVDLSQTPFFPPILDQGSIGSCDWFAVVYYQMTFLQNKQHNRAVAPGKASSIPGKTGRSIRSRSWGIMITSGWT